MVFKLKINRWLLIFLFSMILGIAVYIIGSYYTIEEDIEEVNQHHQLIEAIDNMTRLRQIDLQLQTIRILDNLSTQREQNMEEILGNMTILIEQNRDLIMNNSDSIRSILAEYYNYNASDNNNSTLESEGIK